MALRQKLTGTKLVKKEPQQVITVSTKVYHLALLSQLNPFYIITTYLAEIH
jgi:hypothetical protein